MKKLLITFLALNLISGVASAQMKAGSVNYSVEIDSDDPEMAMVIPMMAGSKLDMYFDGSNTRSEMTMGTMMKMTTIVNAKDNTSLLLSDVMGQKTAVKSSIEEMSSAYPQPNFTVNITTEEKTILGYVCKKAVLTDPEGTEMIVWYTPNIAASTKGQMFFSDKMPGFPLEFTTAMQGMKMKMTATTLDTKLEKGIFDLVVPEGYVVTDAKKLAK